MERNTEIKIRIDTATRFNTIIEQAQKHGKSQILYQVDTYYPTNDKTLRVKTRSIRTEAIEKTEHQFIVYKRPSSEDCRLSAFSKTEITDFVPFATKLLQQYGPPEVVVEKTRVVVILDQTRIHLDTVKNLASPYFIELEVMLRPQQTHQQGQEIVNKVLDILTITQEERTKQVIRGSYREMLLPTYRR